MLFKPEKNYCFITWHFKSSLVRKEDKNQWWTDKDWNCLINIFPRSLPHIFIFSSLWWLPKMHNIYCNCFSAGVVCLLFECWWWWQGQVDYFLFWYGICWGSCFDCCSILSFRKLGSFSPSGLIFAVASMLNLFINSFFLLWWVNYCCCNTFSELSSYIRLFTTVMWWGGLGKGVFRFLLSTCY